MRNRGEYYPCKICEKMFLLSHLHRVCCSAECTRKNQRNLHLKAVIKYNEVNKEKVQAYCRKHHHENKLKWTEADREELKRRYKKYYEKNKEAIKLKRRERWIKLKK